MCISSQKIIWTVCNGRAHKENQSSGCFERRHQKSSRASLSDSRQGRQKASRNLETNQTQKKKIEKKKGRDDEMNRSARMTRSPPARPSIRSPLPSRVDETWLDAIWRTGPTALFFSLIFLFFSFFYRLYVLFLFVLFSSWFYFPTYCVYIRLCVC